MPELHAVHTCLHHTQDRRQVARTEGPHCAAARRRARGCSVAVGPPGEGARQASAQRRPAHRSRRAWGGHCLQSRHAVVGGPAGHTGGIVPASAASASRGPCRTGSRWSPGLGRTTCASRHCCHATQIRRFSKVARRWLVMTLVCPHLADRPSGAVDRRRAWRHPLRGMPAAGAAAPVGVCLHRHRRRRLRRWLASCCLVTNHRQRLHHPWPWLTT